MFLTKIQSFYISLLLISVFYLSRNLSVGKKLPKDEIKIGKHSPKVKQEWKSFLKSRALGEITVRSRSEESPVIGHIWGPNVTEMGTWEEWQYCPNDSFIQSLTVKSYYKQDDYLTDAPGIYAIEAVCKDFYSGKETVKISSGLKDKSVNKGTTETISCPEVISKVNLKQVSDMGCQNDLGLINIKLGCLGPAEKIGILKKEADPMGILGFWSRDMICPYNSAICGLKSRISLEELPRDSNLCGKEAYGIENIGFACCIIEDPSFLCIPRAGWKTRKDVKGYLNNRCRKSNETNTYPCKFNLKHGIEYSPKARASVIKTYESLGYPIRPQIGILVKNFQGSFDNETRYDGKTFYELFSDAPNQIETHHKFINDCDDGAIQELVFECHLEIFDYPVEELYVFYPKIYRCQQ